MTPTRATTWAHIKTELLRINDGHPLLEAFQQSHILGVANLFMMTDQDIENLKFKESDGTISQVPFGYRTMIRVLKSYHSHSCHPQQTTLIDWNSITKDDIDDFRINIYHPTEPIICYVKGAASAKPNPVTLNPQISATRPTTYTKAESFKRGVKREKSHYKVFKHERTWNDWNRNFRSTVKMHDLGNVLDHLYVPSTQEDQELFEEQQIFLYSVFEEMSKTDMGKKLVRDHEITNDAQKIYEKLVSHMKTLGAFSKLLLPPLSSTPSGIELTDPLF